MEEQINDIFKILKEIKIDICVPPQASKSDNGLYNLLIEGNEENDYKKVYSFVDSVKMGYGFYSSETIKLSNMYDRALKANLSEVAKLLNNKSSIVDIVYNCNCINMEFKLQLLQTAELTNGFVIFELIRQLINIIQVGELINSSNYKKIMGEGIIKLASIDINIYKYFIMKFEFKKQFSYAMGAALNAALNNMSVSGRKEYAKTIRLNAKDKTNYENIRILLEHIEKDKYGPFVNDIKDIICNRWREYLENLLNSREFIQDVIINSYFDLILSCFCEKYKDENLFFMNLSKIVEEFNNSIYKWYEKETEFSSMYYIYITKLFLLKKIQEENKISLSGQSKVIGKTSRFFDKNRMMHERYNHVLLTS